MGKNKRRQLDFFDSFHNTSLKLDSQEEIDFLTWLVDAQKLGFVIDWTYQPESIKLFNAVNFINSDGKERCLFRDHVYSADFIVKINPKKSKTLCKEFKVPHDKLEQDVIDIYLDVKGTFNKTERAFGLNLKWVYLLTGIYIYKLIPKNFFKVAGCPMACFVTRKTKKARKMYSGYKSINEALTTK